MSLEDLAFESVERSTPLGAMRLVDKTPSNERIGFIGAEAPVVNVNILALDLGTHTGWAVRDRDGRILYGTESFSPRASWSPGQRWQRFRSWLNETIVKRQIHSIVYELVVFGHSSASSSDVYGGFKALVEMTADSHNIALVPVAVPTVKKHFTGSGRAKKEDMIAEARRRGFRVTADEDNTADALAILHWAIAREVNGSIPPVVRKPKPRNNKTTSQDRKL